MAWADASGTQSAGWTAGEWQERPSEQFAETVVQVVLGERVRFGRTMTLPDYAEPLVTDWFAGTLASSEP